MNEIIEEKGPIGAVVREADHLFSDIVRKTSLHGSFNRIEWHYFNLLKMQQQVSKEEVMEFLSFFDSGTRIQKVIDRFQSEGLAEQNASKLYLSQKGKEVFEEVFTLQEMIKAKSTQDISPEAYSTTIETLQKIMDNLKGYLPPGNINGARR